MSGGDYQLTRADRLARVRRLIGEAEWIIDQHAGRNMPNAVLEELKRRASEAEGLSEALKNDPPALDW